MESLWSEGSYWAYEFEGFLGVPCVQERLPILSKGDDRGFFLGRFPVNEDAKSFGSFATSEAAGAGGFVFMSVGRKPSQCQLCFITREGGKVSRHAGGPAGPAPLSAAALPFFIGAASARFPCADPTCEPT